MAVAIAGAIALGVWGLGLVIWTQWRVEERRREAAEARAAQAERQVKATIQAEALAHAQEEAEGRGLAIVDFGVLSPDNVDGVLRSRLRVAVTNTGSWDKSGVLVLRGIGSGESVYREDTFSVSVPAHRGRTEKFPLWFSTEDWAAIRHFSLDWAVE